jgi:hypothetical protein
MRYVCVVEVSCEVTTMLMTVPALIAIVEDEAPDATKAPLTVMVAPGFVAVGVIVVDVVSSLTNNE